MADTATLAGGCFWGMEEILRKIPGVLKTRVGYTGGNIEDPDYELVKTGTTGHAEAVNIVFDQNILSYKAFLMYFFRMHDPTTKNRQGGDVGSQYRSTIFYHSEEQKLVAEKIITELNQTGKWQNKIITTLEAFKVFYDAEEYHQGYLKKNPGGYTCHYLRT